MRKAAIWLFFIMIVSYSIAFSAVKDMHISWDEVNGIMVSDGVVLFEESERMNILESENASLEGVQTIQVKGISADIQLISEERSDAFVEFKGHYSASGNYTAPQLIVEQDDDALLIEIKHKKQLVSPRRMSLDLLVILPETFTKDIRVEGISGQVQFENGSYENVEVSTVSGEVKTRTLKADKLDVKSTSGEVDIDSASGKVSASTVSGDIEVRYNLVDGKSDLKSTSGDIRMSIPDDAAFGLEVKTTSGEIEPYPEMYIDKLTDRKLQGHVGDYEYSIKASTVSGDVMIRRTVGE